MAKGFVEKDFQIDASELKDLQRLLKMYADKDMQNAMTRANRETATVVRDKARKNVSRENELGSTELFPPTTNRV